MEKKIVKVRVPLSIWEEFYSLYPDKYERSLVLQRLIVTLLDCSQEHISLMERVKEKLGQETKDINAVDLQWEGLR